MDQNEMFLGETVGAIMAPYYREQFELLLKEELINRPVRISAADLNWAIVDGPDWGGDDLRSMMVDILSSIMEQKGYMYEKGYYVIPRWMR